jgi:hypothetical protein
MARVLCIDLDSQSYSGPGRGRGAYTSFSASVQLDLAQSSALMVQYALNTWTLSANKVVNGESRDVVVISPETRFSRCFEV